LLSHHAVDHVLNIHTKGAISNDMQKVLAINFCAE